jgi:hypothetical protein
MIIGILSSRKKIKKILQKKPKNVKLLNMKTTIPTVYELRKQGWKVRVGHYRWYYRFNPKFGTKKKILLLRKEREKDYPDYYLQTRGGKTVVTIKCPLYDNELQGVAECSEEEVYNKQTGIKKAIARALSVYFLDKKNEGN